ncbi:ribosome biogenesis GTP-binding protein YihA/YsxC [Aeromonas cavernicola]|uniref:Probable GTP-binding protein EngB n=1 Tax=Aeromonas cavernicola TaxID=1006623 RepID=A0A2H9U3F2_9GAMM|nr:ribosome biogenesis GTP-binding protein YihA/YsxC [Aeromonas cavernicola]PJG58576.1 YihA family ribosome biogenesis GTP-binding protein [Aeromonas cavernicola]
MESQTLNFNKVHFVTSAPDIRHLPNDGGVEIAFAGRSNAGKSSALNTLTKHKNLARTSKTPGRTQLINLFELEPGKRLVDLPGYGYAQVPLEMKLKWQKSLAEYLQRRESLKGLVILMDIRHPLKETDMNMLEWSAHRQLPVMLLLTKADKLSPGPRNNQVIKVRNAVVNLGPQIQVEAFSSLNNIGVDKLTQTLSAWYLANAAAGSEQDEPDLHEE